MNLTGLLIQSVFNVYLANDSLWQSRGCLPVQVANIFLAVMYVIIYVREVVHQFYVNMFVTAAG